jgi:hypothetical protein
MTLAIVLEVGLGLILVYYILSLIVSNITSKIAKWTELAAQDLEEGLRDLLADSGKLEKFMEHQRIKNLKPKRLKFLGRDIKTYKVDYIPASTFALALFDVLAPGEDGKGTLDDVKSAIEALPSGDTKTVLLGLINSGVTNLEDARKRVESWFDDTMKGVSSLYKQHARRIAIIVALVVTIVTGTDSVAIATSLWEEPSIRAGVAAKVDQFIEDEPEGDVQMFISELEELEIPILWNSDTFPDDTSGWAWKVFGLLITWIAASQGSSFWYQILKQIRSSAASQ